MKKIVFFSAFFVLCVGFWSLSIPVGAQNKAAFFSLKGTPQAKSAADRYSVASVKESDIEINLSKVNASRLYLPLFDGKTWEATGTGTEMRSLTDLTWRGKIREGKFEGDVVLTLKNGYVAGLIYTPDSVYEVVPMGDRQILVQLDQSKFPECAGDIKGDAPKQTAQPESPSAQVDSGDRIDVLVLYSTPVKTTLGGDAQAQTFAQSAIDITNTTYINSKIRQRVRLANAQETAVAETGSLGTELTALRNDATTATTRNTFKADLVAMISNSTDNCGIGNLMGSLPGNSANGHTVTSRTCAVGNLSFPHELGHNMGSHHNPENGGTPTFPYGFGHYVNGQFRTVMSYVDPCTSGCVRQPYFSNPSITFNGFATGLENARDNARSINGTADSIANYRYSGSNLQMTNLNGGEALTHGVNRTLTWASDNITGNVRIDYSRNESTTWATLVPNTPNDGTESITIPYGVSRKFRLRIVSLDNLTVSDSSVTNLVIR